jgi:hypothetical protein
MSLVEKYFIFLFSKTTEPALRPTQAPIQRIPLILPQVKLAEA